MEEYNSDIKKIDTIAEELKFLGWEPLPISMFTEHYSLIPEGSSIRNLYLKLDPQESSKLLSIVFNSFSKKNSKKITKRYLILLGLVEGYPVAQMSRGFPSTPTITE